MMERVFDCSDLLFEGGGPLSGFIHQMAAAFLFALVFFLAFGTFLNLITF